MFRSIALVAILASLVSARGMSSSCTLTATHVPGCCPPVSRFTATAYTDCSSCALTTVTRGPQCDIVCAETRTVDATTTITACATCTSTTTTVAPKCTGCVHTELAETVTESIDCGGCALKTATKLVGGNCDFVCVGGPKTTTAPGTATVTACAAATH